VLRIVIFERVYEPIPDPYTSVNPYRATFVCETFSLLYAPILEVRSFSCTVNKVFWQPWNSRCRLHLFARCRAQENEKLLTNTRQMDVSNVVQESTFWTIVRPWAIIVVETKIRFLKSVVELLWASHGGNVLWAANFSFTIKLRWRFIICYTDRLRNSAH